MAMPNTKDFNVGRSDKMRGWVLITPKGWKDEKQLKQWIKIGYEFACSLPPKVKTKTAAGKKAPAKKKAAKKK